MTIARPLTVFVSSLLLASFLTGCAKGLYIKASPKDSVSVLLNLHKKCDPKLSASEKALLSGKFFPSDGKNFSQDELSNSYIPTNDEKIVIQKLVDAHYSCRSHYIDWVREFAPLSFEIVSSWFANHAEAHDLLIKGQLTYGQAVSYALMNFNFLMTELERLEFATEQAKSESNKRLVEAYFGAVRNRSDNGTPSNSSLITRCGSRGVNFVTKTCN